MPAQLPPFSPLVGEVAYAHLDMHPRRVPGLRVACAGRERCLPEYLVSRRDFACHALEFVAAGAGSLVLAGKRHRLRRGSLFSYGPGVPHEMRSDTGSPLVKYFVDFFGTAAGAALRAAGLQPGRHVSVSDPAGMQRALDTLLEEAAKSHALRHDLAAAHLGVLLTKARETTPALAAGDPRERSRETLEHCLALIEARHTSLHSLAELSAAAGRSPAHLCRVFAQFRQDSPGRVLLRRKLDAAARALATEQLLVKEIAASVGFQDPLHFSRLFRRHYGCSPLEFRRGDRIPARGGAKNIHAK